MSTSFPAATFCDLRGHRIHHDVVLGRSEASLESYLTRLEGKHLVKVVCIDLASVYRVEYGLNCLLRRQILPLLLVGKSSNEVIGLIQVHSQSQTLSIRLPVTNLSRA